MLRSDLCGFSDAYIVVKGTITNTNPNKAKRNKALAFKNNAPFISCRRFRCCNANVYLLECSKNYKQTTGSLWNYYRDEPSDPLSLNSESFE